MNQSYSVESLLRAMAPVKCVIEQFIADASTSNPSSNAVITYAAAEELVLEGWAGTHGQDKFAALISSFDGSAKTNEEVACGSFLPSERYVNKLLVQYVSRVEKSGVEISSECLAEIIARQMQKPSLLGSCSEGAPDPSESCYVSFRVPACHLDVTRSASDGDDTVLIGIRTYPHHNDVGLMRVWEAGACLAEYLLAQPHHVRDRRVVELGSGVGLTGLVASACCGASKVHMTDCTGACLDNIQNNIDINRWSLAKLAARRGNPYDACSITTGRLSWGDHCRDALKIAPKTAGKRSESDLLAAPGANQSILLDADILLAADVIYDPEGIKDVVGVIKEFLATSSSDLNTVKSAIVASPYRIKESFDLFVKALNESKILSTDVDTSFIEGLPRIFPCYFLQPRSDVRISLLTLNTSSASGLVDVSENDE